jgi:chemotaxis protein MotB
VARLLQTKYNVDPARMIAGGSGEYKPKSDNATAEGKSMNRRTEIIITPKLDQFFQLLNPEPAK